MPIVLLIEDDPDMRALECHALESAGYQVTTASNGLEGLQRLALQPKPCLIILDIMMPVMDGLAFLAERRRTKLQADVPVVCVTSAGPDLMAQARRLGATACIDKPADFDDLSALVKRYCLQ